MKVMRPILRWKWGTEERPNLVVVSARLARSATCREVNMAALLPQQRTEVSFPNLILATSISRSTHGGCASLSLRFNLFLTPRFNRSHVRF